MAFELADRPVRPITVEEALRMLEAGVLDEPQRLELLLGVITEKPVKSDEHVDGKERLIEWLWELGPRQLRFEDPLVAADGISMPEPDIAVTEPRMRAGAPTTALLVIKVAKTSFVVDTTIKPSIYAAMGVPDYWVVDVVRSRVIVFRDPEGDEYRTRTTHRPPENLAPLRFEVTPLELSRIFS